ncbi:MAG: Hsp20/alpha crystallin family protein [Candidatus Bathyarchaeia archaeon]
MSFFDFDELFGNFDMFNKNFVKRIQKEMEEIENAIKSGELEGKWDVEKIDKPGMKGYIIKGYFSTEKPFAPFEPSEPFESLKPLRPRISRTPFEIPADVAKKEPRDPLTDVIEEEKAIKIYVELPGEDKNDIKLSFKEGKLEIKAKNFQKVIDLPKRDIDTERAESKYKNGVLEVIIPKKKNFQPMYYQV